jgi:hypothetical protein
MKLTPPRGWIALVVAICALAGAPHATAQTAPQPKQEAATSGEHASPARA